MKRNKKKWVLKCGRKTGIRVGEIKDRIFSYKYVATRGQKEEK